MSRIFVQITGALLLLVAGCGYAYETPAIYTESLRKPPPAISSWPEQVRAALQATHPELISAQATESNSALVVALNGDGSLYNSAKKTLAANDAIGTFQPTYDAVGVDMQDFQVIGLTNGGSAGGMIFGFPELEPTVAIVTWLGPGAEVNPIFYGVLHSTLDPRRPTSQVRTAVRKRYAQLVQAPKGQTFNRVTVFMKGGGGIDRAKADALNLAERQPAFLAVEDFLALGVTPDRVGRIGQAIISEDQTGNGATKILLIDYAWPRRVSEGNSKPVANRFMSATNDGGVSLAIVNHYIPDAFDTPKSTPGPWALLDHEGKVLRTGRFPTADWTKITETFSSLAPGIRLQAMAMTAITNSVGKSVMIAFAWLTPDSPEPGVVPSAPQGH